MTKIKIAQIGVSHEHAAAKMHALRQLKDQFEVVGYVDDSDSKSAKRMDEDRSAYEGLPQLTLDELLAIPDLQAVTVETPNADLVTTATRAMQYNLSMHMDKPGGENLAAFEHLLRGCEARGLAFQMGYMFRHNQTMQWCLNAAKKGWLGDIISVHGSMSHDYGGEAYQTYMEQINGGIMFNLGCHLIDFVVALLGRPESVTPVLTSTPGYNTNTQNNGTCVLAYPHAIATLHACSKEVNGHSQRRLKVCGTKGTFEICPLERFDGTPLTMHLILSEDNPEFSAGEHTIALDIKHDRYVDQLIAFAKCIDRDIASPFTVDHELAVQETVLAASQIQPLMPRTMEAV